MITYFITTVQRRIIKITGPPDAPVAATTPQLGTSGEFYNIASADNIDIWAGGWGTVAPQPERDIGLWRSQDGGDSWADASALLPDGHDQNMSALFATTSPNVVYGGGRRTNDTANFCMVEWDGAIWTGRGNMGQVEPGQIWASAPNDIYVAGITNQGRLWWWNGVIWQRDDTIPFAHQVRAVFGVSPTEVYMWKHIAPLGVYKGTFGAWVLDFPSALVRTSLDGNGLWCSPGGDVYFFACDGAWAYIYKKPAGGVWALDYTSLVPTTIAGGIYGVSDTDITACFAGHLIRGDGKGNWWEWDIVADLGLPPASHGSLRGVWGWKTPFEVTAVDKTLISTVGGETITAMGKFPTDSVMQAYLGPLGTSGDPPCYGGLGLGYNILSLDGTTVQFASPPLAKGDVGLTLIWGSNTSGLPVGALHVVERSWPSKMHRVRGSFAPWKALGARRLGEENQE